MKDDIKDHTQNDWHNILTRLGVDSSLLDGKHHPSPVSGGKDGFRFIDKLGDGYHVNNNTFGDGFALLHLLYGWDFKTSCKEIRQVLGIDSEGYTPPTPAELDARKQQQAQAIEQRNQALAVQHAEVAERAVRIWEAADPTTEHAYLTKKGVVAYDLRMDGKGNLVLVVRISGTITSIQYINQHGGKFFLPCGEVAGGYFFIKGDKATVGACAVLVIIIVEGYATGASIREATGHHVLVAFNANNLAKVAKAAREKCPDAVIILGADNDLKVYESGDNKGDNKPNAGLLAAIEAAKAVNGVIALPNGKQGFSTDWNDVHAVSGLEVVAAGIANALPYDVFANLLPPQEEAQALNHEEAPESVANESKPSSDAFDPIGSVVARLAALSELEYDQVRSSEAEALGVRAATLDKAVKEERKTASTDDEIFEVVEPWGDVVDGKALLDGIADVFNRYAILPNHAPEVAALWILNTYVHDAAYNSPMIMITSPAKQCGKTTTINLFQALVHKPLSVGNISSAAIYRCIEAWTPTLLIDEADTFLKNNDEIAGVINSGHTKLSAFVVRCDGDDNKPKRFSTWCPKIISGIGSQRDTLEDRSIIFPLRRKLPHETMERVRLDLGVFDELKQKCVRWAEDNFAKCKGGDPEIVAGLDDRANDNWRPLLTIAELCEWGGRARTAAVLIRGSVEESESIDTILLKDIQTIFKDQSVTRLSSKRICDLLTAIEDRPWSEWSKGRPITTNKLSGRLRAFGIHPKALRLPNGERLKGYDIEGFKDSFERYCVSKRDNVTSEQYQQKQAIQSVTNKERVTVENHEKPICRNDCHVVTVQKGVSAKRTENLANAARNSHPKVGELGADGTIVKAPKNDALPPQEMPYEKDGEMFVTVTL